MPVSHDKGPKGSAMRYWRRIVKRGQMCERCGATGVRFDAAHIIGRRFAKTRTDERNGWCLCTSCHFTVDEFADEKLALAERTIGMDVYYELREKSQNTRWKMDWDDERERLKELCKELDA